MRYSILLFDADNTILDFNRAEAEAIRATLRQYGLPDSAAHAERYHQINQSLWTLREKTGMSKEELWHRRFAQLFEEMGVSGIDTAAFNRDYIDHVSQGAFLMPHAAEVCRSLSQQHRLFIITNGMTASFHRRFSKTGIAPCFEDVFISEEIGYLKPDLRFFQHVATHIPHFDPSAALVIGDSLTSDMAGGRQAGIDTCWYNPSGAPLPEGVAVTYQIADLRELYTIVK